MAYTTRGHPMLIPEVQNLLIAVIERNASHWRDSGSEALRTLQVGPGRRDVITIQDGEFSDGSETARRVLINSLADVQKARKEAGYLTYESIRTPGWIVQIPLVTMGGLRAAIAPESYRKAPPENLVNYGLVYVEALGDETITRITPEGKDALRLFLFA